MKATKEAKEIQAIVTTGILNYLENTKFDDADFECSNKKVSGITEFDAYLMRAIEEALDAVKSQFFAQWQKCNPHELERYKEVIAWLARLDDLTTKMKGTTFALSTPVNRSEIARQAALIGFDVMEALGENFAGHIATQQLIKKKFS